MFYLENELFVERYLNQENYYLRLMQEKNYGRGVDERKEKCSGGPGRLRPVYYVGLGELSGRRQAVFDGELPLKVKEEIVLKDTALGETMEAAISS